MRSTELAITYDGVDISTDIAPFVLSLAYTDHDGGKADDLQIRLEDRAGLWRGSWYPRKGALITAAITSRSGDEKRRVSCGTFAIDELGVSGPPSVVALKAVSSLTAKGFKREKKTRAWEKITLRAIAAQMAADHGMTLFFESSRVPEYNRVDQREESDLKFLKRLCDDADFNLKVSEEKLIVYESKTLEQRPSVATIALGPDLSRYSFTDKTLEIYRACEVTYHDPASNQDRVYRYDAPDSPAVGQVLKINQRVESHAAAMTLAERSLRRKNKVEQTGEIVMPGNPALLAGINITTSGFGVFDAKQFVTEARHSYDRASGYQTAIKFRRVLSY
jgi:phage protein D